jgi:hypothetical protein
MTVDQGFPRARCRASPETVDRPWTGRSASWRWQRNGWSLTITTRKARLRKHERERA